MSSTSNSMSTTSVDTTKPQVVKMSKFNAQKFFVLYSDNTLYSVDTKSLEKTIFLDMVTMFDCNNACGDIISVCANGKWYTIDVKTKNPIDKFESKYVKYVTTHNGKTFVLTSTNLTEFTLSFLNSKNTLSSLYSFNHNHAPMVYDIIIKQNRIMIYVAVMNKNVIERRCVVLFKYNDKTNVANKHFDLVPLNDIWNSNNAELQILYTNAPMIKGHLNVNYIDIKDTTMIDWYSRYDALHKQFTEDDCYTFNGRCYFADSNDLVVYATNGEIHKVFTKNKPFVSWMSTKELQGMSYKNTTQCVINRLEKTVKPKIDVPPEKQAIVNVYGDVAYKSSYNTITTTSLRGGWYYNANGELDVDVVKSAKSNITSDVIVIKKSFYPLFGNHKSVIFKDKGNIYIKHIHKEITNEYKFAHEFNFAAPFIDNPDVVWITDDVPDNDDDDIVLRVYDVKYTVMDKDVYDFVQNTVNARDVVKKFPETFSRTFVPKKNDIAVCTLDNQVVMVSPRMDWVTNNLLDFDSVDSVYYVTDAHTEIMYNRRTGDIIIPSLESTAIKSHTLDGEKMYGHTFRKNAMVTSVTFMSLPFDITANSGSSYTFSVTNGVMKFIVKSHNDELTVSINLHETFTNAFNFGYDNVVFEFVSSNDKKHHTFKRQQQRDTVNVTCKTDSLVSELLFDKKLKGEISKKSNVKGEYHVAIEDSSFSVLFVIKVTDTTAIEALDTMMKNNVKCVITSPIKKGEFEVKPEKI